MRSLDEFRPSGFRLATSSSTSSCGWPATILPGATTASKAPCQTLIITSPSQRWAMSSRRTELDRSPSGDWRRTLHAVPSLFPLHCPPNHLADPELAPATFAIPTGERYGQDQVVIGALPRGKSVIR